MDAFTLVGWGLAVAGMLLSYILYRRSKREKRLGFNVLTNSKIISIQEEIDQEIEVLVDGEPMEDPTLFEIEIKNIGNLDITQDDFITPVLLDFDGAALNFISQIPGEPEASFYGRRIDPGDKFEFTSSLMKPGEKVVLKFLGDKIGKVGVTGRIVDVAEIEDYGAANTFSYTPKLRLRIILILEGFLITAILVANGIPQTLTEGVATVIFLIGFGFSLEIGMRLADAIDPFVNRLIAILPRRN